MDKPKRGRPLGIRNKPKQLDGNLPSEGGTIDKPKKGRPMGSHNK
jgi:hypothetical protein